MKSAIVTTPAGDLETALLAVIVPTGTTVPASLAALDRVTGGVMARAITSGDFKSFAEGLKALVNGPIMTANDARERLSLPRTPEGEALYPVQGAAPTATGGDSA